MLNVTPPAFARLVHLLSDSTCDVALRIVENKGRLRLRRDHCRAGDTTYNDGGRVVLLIGTDMKSRLSMRTLDVRETNRGHRLKLARR